MPRKKEVPQEAEMEEPVPQDEDPKQDETSENSDNSIDGIIEQWEELQRVLDGESVEELFEKGWRPVLRTKHNGKQYMVLRLHGKDPETGRTVDTERGLGLHISARWDTLRAMYEASKPALPSVIPPPDPSEQLLTPDARQLVTTPSNRSAVLTTKVARVTPIGPSVQINLGTLQWYNWVQTSKGYPGSLDDFINQSVELLFTVHYNKEIAVVDKMEGNR